MVVVVVMILEGSLGSAVLFDCEKRKDARLVAASSVVKELA